MAAGILLNAIFYNISNGKIVRQFPNKTNHSIVRVNKNGKTVHEEFYDYLDGVILDIAVKEHEEYGKFWNIVLKDREGVIQNLQFAYSSGYAMGFLKALPNVDLSKELKIIPNAKKDGDKTKTTIFINQFEKSIKWHYTRENPNGLPLLKKIKIKGKDTWDDTDVMEFLESMVTNKILPKLSNEIATEEVEQKNDLPF
jgi:hypothetical protein